MADRILLFYYMSKKAYRLLVEMVCPGCARDSCHEHVLYQMVTDSKSGLEVEAICMCKNCNPYN